MSRILPAVLIALVCGAPAWAGGSAEPVPNWIWIGPKAEPYQVAFFRKPIDIQGKIASAKLYATCDNEMAVFLNGKDVLKSKSWEIASYADVTGALKEGTNVLAVRAKNQDGPAGLLVKLVIERADKSSQVIVTDSSWRAAEKAGKGWQQPSFDDAAWVKASVVGKLGGGPWKQINQASLAAASRQKAEGTAFLEKLKVAKDFKADLIYSVPKEQGSWVSMTVDPQGRLIVSDQYGKLYRITLPALGDNKVEKVEPLPVDIGEAQGLLWAFDSLYVMVNKHQGKRPSGLYRVKDTTGDGELDHVELLRPLAGGGEHGPHAILLSPDGKSLHVMAGNHTNLPQVDSSRVPKFWGEDSLLPRMWDASGHAVGRMAPAGWICKIDPDGKNWELVIMGFRNQYDAAFNRDGELFTYDSDMEWDMNTPWYKPTRAFHCVSGGDAGWRGGTGKFPTYYPDGIPPVVDIGPGSPTGVVFGYGARFPAKYQEALYLCDWSYGKLYALHLKPDGASYKGEFEEFIRGTPLPLTDIVINPKDGAMYFAVGGRKAKSGLYRVTYHGKESTAPSMGSTDGAEARTLRKKLEAYHGKQNPKAVDVAWPHLGSQDRFIRFAARVAIEHQPAKQWQERALAEKEPQAALTALLALARAGDKSLQPQMLEALERIEWKALSHAQKLELLRVYALTFIRMGEPDEKAAAQVIARLDPVYPSNDIQLNDELCKVLVYLQAPSAAAKTLDLLNKALTQEEQLAHALSLRNLKSGWTPKLREDYFKWFIKAATYKGGNSFQGFVKNIRKEAIDNLTQQEQVALKPILDIDPHKAQPVQAPPRPFVKNWKIDEVVQLAERGLKKERDFDRGRAMFAAANCFACHRFAQEGGAYGPDLTGVAGRYSLQDLVENIIDPSKVISDQYEAVMVALTNGQFVQGRIVNLHGDNLIINPDMLNPNKLITVNRNQIDLISPSKVSMMPTGLLDTLNEEEVLDLLAYLLSGGDRQHALFRKKE